MTEREKLGWRWWLWPLGSRKVQMAIAQTAAAWVLGYGIDNPQIQVLATMAVMALNGLAVILGIAHEDAAEKSR